MVAYFFGTWDKENEIAEKQFIQNKCCDVNMLEEYCLEQERLYYKFNKPTHTVKKTFIVNIPGSVAEMMEAKLKADGATDLTGYSFAICIRWLQN